MTIDTDSSFMMPMASMRMIRDRVLTLSNGDIELDLYNWVHNGVQAAGVEALAGIKGFGIADVQTQWSEGAGDGAFYRGGRTLPRTIEIPLYVRGQDRTELNRLISEIARVTDRRRGLATLSYSMPDGELWHVKVARIGGGDWSRIADSDNRTWVRLPLLLKAGNPYWTRDRAESFIVSASDDLQTLLPNWAALRLTSGSAFGTRTVENEGDADGYPIWRASGPFTRLTLEGARGEVLDWVGTLPVGKELVIDSQLGTIIDSDGVNRYDGLAYNPRFWAIEPGFSEVSVLVEGASVGNLQSETLLARNKAKNPGFERPAASIQVVRYNYMPTPTPESNLTNWRSNNGTLYPLVYATDGDGGLAQATRTSTNLNSTASSIYFSGPTAGRFAVTPGVMYQTGLRVTHSVGNRVISGSIIFYDSSGNSMGYFGENALPLEANTPTDMYTLAVAAPIGAVSAAPIFSVGHPDTVSGTVTAGEVTKYRRGFFGTPGPFFSGSYSPEADLTPSWVGTVNNSESRLSAYAPDGVGGGGSTVIQSSQWNSAGTNSMRIISKIGVTGSAYAELANMAGLTLDEVRGKTHTALINVRTEVSRELPPALGIVYRPSEGEPYLQELTQAPSEPGIYELRLMFTVPESTTEFYLRAYDQNIAGSPSSWWDELTVVEGEYFGAPFDGSSIDLSGQGLYQWDGTANNSSSSYYEATRVNFTKVVCSWQPRRWAVV